MNSLDKNKLAI